MKKRGKSYLIKMFGDTPQIRVFDFLIDNQMFDYPMTELSRGAKVSYNSIKIFFPQLVKSKILIFTRKVGKSDYYKLNLENAFVKDLIRMDWSMVKRKNSKSQEVCN